MTRLDGEALVTTQAEQRPTATQATPMTGTANAEVSGLSSRLLQKKIMRRALQRKGEGEGGQQGQAASADAAGQGAAGAGQDLIDRGEKAVSAGKTSFHWTPAEPVGSRARAFDFDDPDANAALMELINHWDGTPESLLEAPTGGTGVPYWISAFRKRAAGVAPGTDKKATLALHMCDAVEKQIAAKPPAQQQAPQSGGAASGAGPTKGEQFRDELYKGAKSRFDSQTDIVSEATIKAQKGAYSTCHDFEYQVEGDASAATNADAKVNADHKKLNELLDKEFDLQGDVNGAKKTVEMAEAGVKQFDDSLAADAANPNLNDQQRKIRARSYEKPRAAAMEKLEKARAKLKAAEEALAANQAAQGSAFTRFVPGSSARPKRGDLLRIGVYEDRDYTANGTTVRLQRGSFLHVCVFDSLTVQDADTEIWKTIDGGGQKPTIGFVNSGPSTVKPKEAKIGNNLLMGWTNVASLVDDGLPGAKPATP